MDITEVAADLIAAFGSEAALVVDSRVLESARDGKNCGVEFWTQVGAAVRVLAREGLLQGRPS